MPVSAATDSEGHFAITAPAGSYRLWAERPGFARQTYGARTPQGAGSVIALAPGQQIKDLVLPMVPLGAISGRVLDEDGDTLQGVGVQVLRFSFAAGRKQLVAVAGTSSNDRGEYRAFGLTAGRYFLLAKLPGAPLTHPMEKGGLMPEAQQPFAALYYPGVADLESASVIALGEGSEAESADFRLKKTPAVTVRGRVVAPLNNDHLAAGQMQVVLAHNDGNAASFIDRASAVVDRASGRFEFRGVAPGSYWVVASQLHSGRTMGARVPLEVSGAAQVENVNITLRSSVEISGRVEMEGGASINFQKMNARLTAWEGLTLGPEPTSKIGVDGSLQFSGVTPSLWDFRLDSLPDGLWIKTATFGDVDALTGEIRVLEGQPGLLRIVLAGSGAEISGVVTENDQPKRATVVLAPADPQQRRIGQMFRAAATQEQGLFVFKGVRPGNYKLFAFEDIEAQAWLDSEILKSAEALGEPVTVAEGERVNRRVRLVPPELLVPAR
jgi:hypothetical protein